MRLRCCLTLQKSETTEESGDWAKCPNADINEQDLKGRTALYLASWMGHLDAVNEFLVLPTIEVNKGLILTGETAYSIASKKSHFDVMETLSRHKNVDVNKGWFRDRWTTFVVRQQFSTSSSKLNGSKVAETGRKKYLLYHSEEIVGYVFISNIEKDISSDLASLCASLFLT